MRVALALLSALSLVACVNMDTGTGSDAGSTSSSADGGVTQGTGTNCGTDPTTGVTLCDGLSSCPGLSVSQSAFPECGFRMGGASAFDLECLCPGNYLCPVGAPTSCSDAQQLLSQEMSSVQVCAQMGTGGCLPVGASGGSGSGSGSSSGSSTTGLSAACQACVSSCGGTPACYQSCGC